MGGFGSVEEVLDFAIDREMEANQFYTDLAEQADTSEMRKVLQGFAKEELGHKAKLETMKRGKVVLSKGRVTGLKIADYMVDANASPDMNYADGLVLAMQKEKASFHLYTDLAEVVENEAQRRTFLSLAQEEARHKLRFEIEYDDVVLKEN